MNRQGPIVIQGCGSSSIYDRVGIIFPMLILPRRSFSMSGSLLLGVWGRDHCLALTVASGQYMCWRVGWVSRFWMELLNSKWYLVGSAMLPFSIWRVNLLLVSSMISSFLGPSAAFIVWFRKFQKSQAMSHSFLMRDYIYIFPEVFSPSDWRWRFWISAHLFSRSPMRAFS